jgi:hypothetical protein
MRIEWWRQLLFNCWALANERVMIYSLFTPRGWLHERWGIPLFMHCFEIPGHGNGRPLTAIFSHFLGSVFLIALWWIHPDSAPTPPPRGLTWRKPAEGVGAPPKATSPGAKYGPGAKIWLRGQGQREGRLVRKGEGKGKLQL